MVACLDKPSLELIQEPNLKGRMKDGLLLEFVVGEFSESNQAKLKQLENRQERLTILSHAVGISGVAGLAIFSPSAVLTLPPLGLLLGALQTTNQRFLLMTELVKAFEDEDVEIAVGLEPDGVRPIDFFLKFPDKEFILIQIRSLGDSRVTYDEEREALRFKKRGGGLKTWKPDPLFELAEQERWLRRQRYDLLGTSSRDRRRPLAKLLVLSGNTTLGDHPEHLYDRIDDQKHLTIRKFGTTAIAGNNQVVDFIRGYLASRRSRKTSQN